MFAYPFVEASFTNGPPPCLPMGRYLEGKWKIDDTLGHKMCFHVFSVPNVIISSPIKPSQNGKKYIEHTQKITDFALKSWAS